MACCCRRKSRRGLGVCHVSGVIVAACTLYHVVYHTVYLAVVVKAKASGGDRLNPVWLSGLRGRVQRGIMGRDKGCFLTDLDRRMMVTEQEFWITGIIMA
jgi:hypothetical protein